MDISDGLAGDLAKLCAASGVSAVIDLPSVPVSAPIAGLLASGRVAIESLISGGDDYEILCTVPERRCAVLAQLAKKAGVVLSTIGTIVAGAGAPRFLDREGRELAFSRGSYSHF
jgi:thiamine-monophosphate kinase